MTAGPTTDDATARRWIEEHRAGVPAAEALAFFDGLPAVPADAMLGRWRGSELRTGSALDGLLEAYGWYGKEFLDTESVHPLLFRDSAGRPRPVAPALVPMGLLRARPDLVQRRPVVSAFAALRPALFTSRPKARLRAVEHRGVVTAAMVYDALPIIDVFRRIDGDRVLGLMDMRGLPDPFLFLLERDAG
ncbi:DUF4334 domain-containing protein [Blastococcus deserti]|uniref:DUF4334 domain-containing protein n=1 Tax=Blastococcus deserti TaxID=2259033 RepID=A0ABW4XEN7_9ACTN